MNKTIKDPCVICEESIEANAANPNFWTKGNNAEPVASGQCCDICNINVVLVRLLEIRKDSYVRSN
jgi:hypothetical protein